MKKIKVGIIGHTGRLGLPLWKILSQHPYAEVVYTESRSVGIKGDFSKIEIAFLAMPPGEGRRYIRRFSNKKVIDLSIDHRHNARWTYGLPEVFGAEISGATKVANPGCYATSIILGLHPLSGKIKQASISSTSGISGAGMMVATEDNFLVYKEGKRHLQMREMRHALGINNILFVPQRIDTADRGLVSTIFVQCDMQKGFSELYEKAYEKCPFVRMKTEIETKNVIGTNFCDIKIVECEKNLIIISALDNLIKGGAGQAVQNFNLMYGFPETTGLI